LTALPVVETQAQNISAYIPTNLISITDGQIYLSPALFEKGHLPAIDIGTSVSRVGGKVQLPAFRAVAGNLRLMYAQFEELETFARFGTQLDAETRRKLTRGRRVREVLKQREHDLIDAPEQIAVLLAATEGLYDEIAPEHVATAQKTIRKAVRDEAGNICEQIASGKALKDADRDRLIGVMRDALSDAPPGGDDGDP
jgi:F-type H+-transporting ATPase subunit alpha